MLRPLLITENFPPARGGMAQSCDRIVRGLRARGVQLDVVHLDARHGELRIEQHERGRLIRCPVDDDPGHAANVLWNMLSREPAPPSHVLAFGGLMPLLCAPVFAAWLQVPLLTMLRGNDFDTGIVSLRRGPMLRDALARSAAVCVVSEDHRHKVATLFPHTRVAWIPNGIDTRDWRLLDMDLAQARSWRAAHVEPARRVVGLFGRLKRKKGGVCLLDALEGCACAAQLHLLIVGQVEAEMHERLALLADAITHTHVPFLDRFELLRWYAACDAVAIPSLYDGMPNVALEAGALGIPILGSTAGGLADLLDDGDNALTFAPGDVYACRRALDEAAEMPLAALQTLGRNMQHKILRQYDHESEALRYQQLLLDTVQPLRPDAHVIARVADISMED